MDGITIHIIKGIVKIDPNYVEVTSKHPMKFQLTEKGWICVQGNLRLAMLCASSKRHAMTYSFPAIADCPDVRSVSKNYSVDIEQFRK